MSSKRIQGITIQIGADTTSLNKSLESIDKTLSSTKSKLNDVHKLLQLKPGNFTLLKQQAQGLSTEIATTKTRLTELKNAADQLKSSSNPLDQEKWDALQREIVDTQTKLSQLKQEYINHGTAQGAWLVNAGDQMQQAGQQISSAGKQLTLGITMPLIGIGTAAVKTAAEFESQMDKVGAVSGASEDELSALTAKAREMGSKTKFSASEAGEAFEYMAMAGWKTEDMLEGVEGIMNLAAASGEDLGTTSDIVTDALTAFGLSAKDSGRFADVLAAASSNANTNVSMMGETFKYVAPVAGTLGYSAEDTAIAIGLMANSGIKASQAGTSLRAGLVNLANPMGSIKEAMDRYGISLTDSTGRMYTMRELMVQMRVQLQGLSQAEQANAAASLFGENAMSGWLAIINASDADFIKLTSSIDNSTGAAENMAATMNDNLNGKLTILKSQLQELAISAGETLMPMISKVVEKIQSWVDKLNKLSPEQKDLIVKIGLAAAALGPLLVCVGKVITGAGSVVKGIGKIINIGGSLISFISGGGGLISGIGGLLTACAPFLLKGLVVVGIIAAVVLIIKNFDKIIDGIKKVGEWFKKMGSSIKQSLETLKNVVSSGFSMIKTGIGTAWDAIKTGTASAWSIISTKVTSGISAVKSNLSIGMQAAKSVMSSAWSAMSSAAASGMSGIASKVSSGMSSLRGTVQTAWTTIRTGASTAWSGISSVVSQQTSRIAQTARNAFGGVGNVMSNVFSNLSSSISTPISRAVSFMRNAANAIRSAFNFQIQLPKIKLPHISVKWTKIGDFFSIPHLSIQWYKKAYENPMIFTRPTVLQTAAGAKGFGDGRGAEMVYGHENLMRDIRQAVAGTGEITINVYGQQGQDVNAIAQAVQNKLTAWQKQKARAYA